MNSTSKLVVISLFLFLFSSINTVVFASHSTADPHVRDLRILTTWFAGEFDNDSQVWLEGRRDWSGLPEEKHQRMHTIHQRIDSTHLGDHAFYVEEFLEDDPTNIARQRIVTFATDVEAKGIVMKIYFLKEAKLYIGAFKNRALLNKTTEEDLFGLDGCDVIFHREGDQYHGSMRDKACQFGKGDLLRYSVHDMIVSKDQYWRVDRTFLVKDDSFHKGHPNSEPTKMRRVVNYTCNVSFHEIAYYVPSDKDKRYTNVIIHNQGGKQWFDNPIKNKKYALQLRKKEYPFYKEGSDFLMLRLIEEGKKASELITMAESNSSLIAFQIGWASGLCKVLEE